jgi:hypothetical protein
VTDDRPSADRIRDLVMLAILGVWTIYAGAAVVQLFTSGAKVLESLPPFWFWGIPLGPYGAMYAPWRPGAPALPATTPPEPPAPGAAS